MFRIVTLLISIVFTSGVSSALDADFFKRQKVLAKEEKRRLKGASSYTKKRQKLSAAKFKEAVAYERFRKKQSRQQRKKDADFEKSFKEPVLINKVKLRQAKNYAKKKRKRKAASWEEQNLEFGINVMPSKEKNN